MEVIRKLDKAGRIGITRDMMSEAGFVPDEEFYIELEPETRKLIFTPKNTTRPCQLSQEDVDTIKKVFLSAEAFGLITEEQKKVLERFKSL